MLAENIDRWNRQIREEGRQEGEARVLLRLLRLKFGPLASETGSGCAPRMRIVSSSGASAF